MGTKDKYLEEFDRVAAVLKMLIGELAKEMQFNACSDIGNVNAIVLFAQLWRHFFARSPLCEASMRMDSHNLPLATMSDAQRIVMSELAKSHGMLSNLSPDPEESKKIIASLYDICSTLYKTHLPTYRRLWTETSEEDKVKSGLAIAGNPTTIVEGKGTSND